MQRRYTVEQYLKSVACLRDAFPSAAFTTDILTGFPGETEEEYQQTRDIIRKVGFARIHVFPYSPREGTRAAAMPGQLSKAVKARRTRELIALGHEVSLAYRTQWIGRQVQVIPETRSGNGHWSGYTPEYLPVDLSGAHIQYAQPVQAIVTGLSEDGLNAISFEPIDQENRRLAP